MYRVIVGFIAGVYVGTWCDCKPNLERITSMIRDNFPKSK